MTEDEATRRGGILRDAIQAIEKAEKLPELQFGELAKLYAAKSALEYALMRIAIKLLEQDINNKRRS